MISGAALSYYYLDTISHNKYDYLRVKVAILTRLCRSFQ
jgi:hypothetical protein